MVIKLAVDAGHGFNTAGKRTPDGEREWTFNNTVLVAFINELNKYDGIEIKRFDDTTGKTDISLDKRTNGANSWKANYYISFHHNANTSKWGTWTGVETFVYTNAQSKSLELAKAIHPALVKGYQLKDRGIKTKNLHIVRETTMPAILVEGGFMDSTIDIKVLRDSNKLKNAGVLMARAFAEFTKLKLKVVTIPKKEEVKTLTTNHLNISKDTVRNEAINVIKNAVATGIFSSKHEDVSKYDDETLKNYMLVALARKK